MGPTETRVLCKTKKEVDNGQKMENLGGVNFAQAILRMEEDSNVRWHLKMKSPLKDTTNWCTFHKDLGHMTRDYTNTFKKK